MHTHRMTRAVPAGRLRASRGQLCLCRCASRGFACDTEKFSGAVYITEHVCKAQHSIITLGQLPKDYPAAAAAPAPSYRVKNLVELKDQCNQTPSYFSQSALLSKPDKKTLTNMQTIKQNIQEMKLKILDYESHTGFFK